MLEIISLLCGFPPSHTAVQPSARDLVDHREESYEANDENQTAHAQTLAEQHLETSNASRSTAFPLAFALNEVDDPSRGNSTIGRKD
ncbi:MULTISPECIES: hypothetical protein [unclassified Rhizobium]|uniref:hypothetical protein n=1 Tax=unclassified Rhizobium TaxID=2613769 RepID=UPI001621CD2F|nr:MULTISPECIES: hypothetical protein [unclassified Rhizobium]MBB3317679.1 hypothetical protein [Rhizobium sp. BK181]MBB3544564.1 hypothetical protein [Rhizobium sp. BK399]